LLCAPSRTSSRRLCASRSTPCLAVARADAGCDILRQPKLPFSVYGTVAMARSEDDANDASSQFFFLLFDPELTTAGRNLMVELLPYSRPAPPSCPPVTFWKDHRDPSTGRKYIMRLGLTTPPRATSAVWVASACPTSQFLSGTNSVSLCGPLVVAAARHVRSPDGCCDSFVCRTGGFRPSGTSSRATNCCRTSRWVMSSSTPRSPTASKTFRLLSSLCAAI